MPLDPDIVRLTKGFLEKEEGDHLYRVALAAAPLGPCLEIGSYCGRSTICIGTACRESGQVLFTIDHHRGSEEQQPGEEYFDPALFDPLPAGSTPIGIFAKRSPVRASTTRWFPSSAGPNWPHKPGVLLSASFSSTAAIPLTPFRRTSAAGPRTSWQAAGWCSTMFSPILPKAGRPRIGSTGRRWIRACSRCTRLCAASVCCGESNKEKCLFNSDS